MAKQPSEREQLIRRAEELHVLPELIGIVPTQSGQRMAAMQAAVVRFMDISRPVERPDFIHGPLFAVVMSMNEKGGRWLRAVEHRAHIIGGVVVIGGTGGANEKDSKGGLWTVLAVESPASSAEGIALQRAALEKTFYRNDLPEGMRAIPEGLFKDMRAKGELPISLFYNHFLYRGSNRRLRRALKVAYTFVEHRLEHNMLPRQVQLKPPRIWSTAADGKPLRLRWRDAEEAEIAEQALDYIDEVVASRIERGDWSVGAFPEMRAGIDGSVKVVDGHTVTLVDGDGNEVTVTMPLPRLRQYVQQVTGFDASDMPVHPLVEPGRVVGPETCLFGPVKPSRATVHGLRRSLEVEDLQQKARRKRGLHLCRLWAVLSESQSHEGRTLYPNELVAPRRLDQVYFQIAGDRRTRWDRSVQQIALERRPEKCLRHADVGFAMDLFNTSHRIANEQRITAARARTKGGNGNAAQAGEKTRRKPTAPRMVPPPERPPESQSEPESPVTKPETAKKAKKKAVKKKAKKKAKTKKKVAKREVAAAKA